MDSAELQNDTSIPDSQPESDESKIDERDNKWSMCIPFQSTEDIYGKRGACRTWSCIWLAHLLRKTIESLSKEPHKSIGNPGSRIGSKCKQYGSQLKQRGKYPTRRTGNYWWKTGDCVFW